jgi:hypothetical protein
MSRRGHSRETWEWGKRHRAVVQRKNAKVSGLVALLETYEKMAELDPEYIRDIKRRLNAARNQCRTMGL